MDYRKLIHDAARACGLDGHVTEFQYKKHCFTRAEQIAASVCGVPFLAKTSYLYQDTLDCAFFYDKNGKPTVAFSGFMKHGSHDYENAKKALSMAMELLDEMERQRNLMGGE